MEIDLFPFFYVVLCVVLFWPNDNINRDYIKRLLLY